MYQPGIRFILLTNSKVLSLQHAAQKARREAEEKIREEAERQRIVEKEERKKRTVEYLQQL